MSKSKRVVVVSDLHCGHRVGLTPPQWQTKPDEKVPQKAKWARIQSIMWRWYTGKLADLQPIDILICNGDAIEGKGEKSGGCELIAPSRDEQAEMAFQAIAQARARTYRMTRGTPYHTGTGEDFENNVAEKLDCKIGDHEWYTINGVVFDVKHFVPGSAMPHTKATGVLGDVLWNMVWNAREESQPDADIFIRSHLHSANDVMGLRPDQRAFITPALQGLGSRFGARQCRRTVDIGMLSFDITGKGEWSWKLHLMSLKSQAASAEQL